VEALGLPNGHDNPAQLGGTHGATWKRSNEGRPYGVKARPRGQTAATRGKG